MSPSVLLRRACALRSRPHACITGASTLLARGRAATTLPTLDAEAGAASAEFAPTVKMSDFAYTLPDELIARYPAEPRDSSRLLVDTLSPEDSRAAEGAADVLRHALHAPSAELATHVAREAHALDAADGSETRDGYVDLAFSSITRLLPGRVHLVFNDSRVFAARLSAVPAHGATALDGAAGSPVEVLLLGPEDPAVDPASALSAPVGTHAWRAMVRSPVAEGARAAFVAAAGGSLAGASAPLAAGLAGQQLWIEVAHVHSAWVEEGEPDGVEAAVTLALAPPPSASAGTPAGATPAASGGLQPTRSAEAPSVAAMLQQLGEVPIPPYLGRKAESSDETSYQTVYASSQRTGSVAAPTAGLHFTAETLAALREAGARMSRVALHVGAGTFKPVTSESVDTHEMHCESFEVSPAELDALAESADACVPIVAVGTTSARVLESLYWLGLRALGAPAAPQRPAGAFEHLAQWEAYELAAARGPPVPTAAALRALAARARSDAPELPAGSPSAPARAVRGSTALCIAPGYTFRVLSGLVTNLHQPDSTLLLLVGALLGGPARLHALYAHALERRYRFLSYGDACLLPNRQALLGAGAEQAAGGAGACAAAAGGRGGAGAAELSGADGRPAAAEAAGGRVLLHSCCAPCSGAMIAQMQSEGFDVTVFFYNPNIHPRREYEQRKAENKRFAEQLGIPFVDADYDADEWHRRARGMEFLPERGARCTMCFDMRMERTALYAAEHGYSLITTTNATSRWKDAKQVDDSGYRAAAKYDGVEYWCRDWQTDEMSARKYEINAERRFYKQEYCGCTHSLRDSNIWRAKQGLPPVQIGAADSVYTDPVADSEEESVEVVETFFKENSEYEAQLRATYGRRRKDAGSVDENNW